MVAVGDFGIREREQIVRLAISHGWIVKAEEMARSHGVSDPVVLLMTVDALEFVRFRCNRSPRDRGLERLQRKARCKPFTMSIVSYASLLRAYVGESWQQDMENMRRKGGTAVVCINRTGQFLVAVKPGHPRNG
jgi:hypothetical protein